MPTGQGQTPDRAGAVNAIYILNLVGLVVGVTTLIGLIMAYVNRSGSPVWAHTHDQLQIRTFWFSL